MRECAWYNRADALTRYNTHMTITRLLGIGFGALLLLRLSAPLLVLFMPQLRQKFQQMQVILDVSGGLIVLLIAGSLWWRDRPEIAIVLLLLGIPVFIGAYRALPAWWWGTETQRRKPKNRR